MTRKQKDMVKKWMITLAGIIFSAGVAYATLMGLPGKIRTNTEKIEVNTQDINAGKVQDAVLVTKIGVMHDDIEDISGKLDRQNELIMEWLKKRGD